MTHETNPRDLTPEQREALHLALEVLDDTWGSAVEYAEPEYLDSLERAAGELSRLLEEAGDEG